MIQMAKTYVVLDPL